MIYFALLALAVIALDRVTKWLVIRHIPLGHEIPVLGQWAQFTHIKNTGAAFGLFPGSIVPLVVVSLVASIIVVVLAQRVRDQPSRLLPLGLILGGAVGNLIDRIFLRKVTDFILVGIPNGARFPVFNVADSAVTIGVAVLAFGIYFAGKPDGEATPPEGSERIDLTPVSPAPEAPHVPEVSADAVPGDPR